MQTKFAEVWGYKIRYLEDGVSESTIVLLHGLGGSADRWLEAIPLLGKRYRVVAPDMIGFGYSDKPSEDYTIEFFSKFLSAFMRSLGLKKVFLVGSSLGGQIAASCASRDPVVEKLVLVSPSGSMKTTTPVIDSYIMAALYPNALCAKEAFEKMSFSGTVDDSTIQDFMARMSIPNAKLAFISAVLGIKNSEIGGTLGMIRAPTLLVWGRQDQMIPIIHSEMFASSIKDCTFVDIDQCGHLPHMEVPETFCRHVLDFIDSKPLIAEFQKS